jgi:hypothetical protein
MKHPRCLNFDYGPGIKEQQQGRFWTCIPR